MPASISREKPWLLPERRNLFAAEAAALPEPHKRWLNARDAEARQGYREREMERVKADRGGAAKARSVRFAEASAAMMQLVRRPITSQSLLQMFAYRYEDLFD